MISGDIIGSYYKVHCTKSYDFPFEKDSAFTDDSVLTAAVYRAILQNGSEIRRFEIRRRTFEFSAQYRQFYSYFPHAGFGNMFIAWAKSGGAKNAKRYANGAAMRVVPISYAYDSLEQTLPQAKAHSQAPRSDHKRLCGCVGSLSCKARRNQDIYPRSSHFWNPKTTKVLSEMQCRSAKMPTHKPVSPAALQKPFTVRSPRASSTFAMRASI